MKCMKFRFFELSQKINVYFKNIFKTIIDFTSTQLEQITSFKNYNLKKIN